MTAPTAIDAYLDALSEPAQRRALSDLRRVIRSHLPDALECISYAMPAHRLPGPKGKVVIGYAAFARQCGVYSHSGTVAPLLAADFPGWAASKSGFTFTPDHPLPEALVARMIALRLAEIPHYG